MLQLNKYIYLDYDKFFWFLLWYKWRKIKKFSFNLWKEDKNKIKEYIKDKNTEHLDKWINNYNLSFKSIYRYYFCNCIGWYYHWYLIQNKEHLNMFKLIFQDTTNNDEIILLKEELLEIIKD